MPSYSEWQTKAQDWLSSNGFPPGLDAAKPLTPEEVATVKMYEKKISVGDIKGAFNAFAPTLDALDHEVYVPSMACAALHLERCQPEKVLDAGCGIGIYTCFLAEMFPAVTFIGTDISNKSIERARGMAKDLPKSNHLFAVADHRKISSMFGMHHFDVILSIAALHFEPQHHETIVRALVRTLQPGGFFLREFPCNENIYHTWQGIYSRLDLRHVGAKGDDDQGHRSLIVYRKA